MSQPHTPADEAFVCGTAAEVVGLREVDHRPVGAGVPGPVTRRLQEAYHDAVRSRLPRYDGWLTHLGDRVRHGTVSARPAQSAPRRVEQDQVRASAQGLFRGYPDGQPLHDRRTRL